MKKTLFVVGSIAAALLLLGAVFPSVAGYQTGKALNEHYKQRIEEKFHSFLGEQDPTVWQPGLFILLFMAVMQAVMQEVAEGNWFPGMISGAFILYLVLAWLLLFADNADIDF